MVLMALVQSVIRRLPNSMSPMEESMAGHVGVNGVYFKVREGKCKGDCIVGPKSERLCLCSSGAFKTYHNLREGRTRWFPSNNQRVERGVNSSWPGEGGSCTKAWLIWDVTFFHSSRTLPNFRLPQWQCEDTGLHPAGPCSSRAYGSVLECFKQGKNYLVHMLLLCWLSYGKWVGWERRLEKSEKM
jgi:hypothetical protein